MKAPFFAAVGILGLLGYGIIAMNIFENMRRQALQGVALANQEIAE